MPIVKNRLFQPVGVLLDDGRMLYLQSRQTVEVSDADVGAGHLKNMLASEQLTLAGSGAWADTALVIHQSESLAMAATKEPERRATKAGVTRVTEKKPTK